MEFCLHTSNNRALSDFSWEGGDNLAWKFRRFTVKENHTGSMVSDILCYRQKKAC